MRNLLTDFFLEQDLLIWPLEIFAGFRKKLRDGKTDLHAHCPGMAILFPLPLSVLVLILQFSALLYCSCLSFLSLQMPQRRYFSVSIQNAFGFDKNIWFVAPKQGFHDHCALFTAPLAVSSIACFMKTQKWETGELSLWKFAWREELEERLACLLNLLTDVKVWTCLWVQTTSVFSLRATF